VIIGPDGRSHRLAYRILRAPSRIGVKLEGTGVDPGQGYDFAVLGAHDAHVAPLLRQVRTMAEREVVRQYVEPATRGPGWRVTDGDEVVGRFIWSDEGAAGAPFDVAIDGRTLTWEQFGEALAAYEGWNFRLLIEGRVAEAETETEAEAEVIKWRTRRSQVRSASTRANPKRRSAASGEQTKGGGRRRPLPCRASRIEKP
jgi:hypothetical protein